jgi:hypothetical protein
MLIETRIKNIKPNPTKHRTTTLWWGGVARAANINGRINAQPIAKITAIKKVFT